MNNNKNNNNMNEEPTNNKVSKWDTLEMLIPLIGIIASITFVIVMFSTSSGKIFYNKKEKSECVEKTKLKKDISIVIKNGGDLAAVTNTYNNRAVEKKEIMSNSYYDNEDLTLSKVLEDLRSDYYHDSVPQNKQDSLYMNCLNSIRDEFSRNNPFEELEPDQRVYFQNIQTKLPNDYDQIKDDMMRISDALKEKNALTQEYLQKSTSSFWISISAVIVTLILGLVQLFQNSSKKSEVKSTYNNILTKISDNEKILKVNQQILTKLNNKE